MKGCRILLPVTWFLLSAPTNAGPDPLVRSDFHALTSDGFQIAIREVKLSASETKRTPPVILVHGVRAPGIASFDLAVPGGSLAADLAKSGFPIYVMDARGYGNSTRPKAMDLPPEENRPVSRVYEVVRDIDAVVTEVRHRNQTDQVALFGWATGAMWCGMYASEHPEAVSHLILLNGLYGGSSEHSLLGHGSSSEDHLHPGRFDEKTAGAYSIADARALMSRWDASIPEQDKSTWRDPAVAQAYQDAALASDPTSLSRNPASLRAPNGGLEDSFYQAIGRPLYDGSSIVGSVLIVRSGNDFWSRPEDAETLAGHLDNAKQVSVLTLPHATHFVHLDRAERGRAALIDAILAFLVK
jgi:pimeloyl-ACP methyl ester carboxylesterase